MSNQYNSIIFSICQLFDKHNIKNILVYYYQICVFCSTPGSSYLEIERFWYSSYNNYRVIFKFVNNLIKYMINKY